MATNNLGSLTLDLVTRIGNFIEPLNQAERKARSSSENIASSFNVASIAAKAFGAVMAGASVAGLTAFVTRAIDAGNEIKNLAKLANASTTVFQYYAKGAETAGISIDKFADQMKDMQDRIGEYQQTAGGPLADFFKNIAPKVGVTISQFQKLSGPEALQLYYDSLVKANASQNDMKFYMEAIISDSSLLIPLLENGGAGFKKYGDAAERAGSIMDDAMIKKLSEAKENLWIMNQQWQGVEATLINGIVPIFNMVASNMDNISAAAVALGTALGVKLAVQGAILTKEFTLGMIEGIRYQMTLARMAGVTMQTASAMGVLRGAMAFLGGPAGLGLLAVQGLAAGAAFFFMKNKSDEATKSLNQHSISVAEVIKKYQEMDVASQRTQLRAEKKSLEELTDEYNKANSNLISLAINIGRFDGSTGEASKSASALAMEFKKGNLTAAQLSSEINKLSGVSEESKAKIDAQAATSIKLSGEYLKQKNVVNSLSETTGKATDKQDKFNKKLLEAEAASKRAQAAYSEYMKTFNTDYMESSYKLKIRQKFGNKYSEDELGVFEEWAKRHNYDSQQMQTPAALNDLANARRLLAVNKEIKDIQDQKTKLEQAATEQAKKKADYAQKNYELSSLEIDMLKKVSVLASQNGLDKLEEKYGLPKNMLAALMAQESKGEKNARSRTGAVGYFQTTEDYRKDNRITIADSKNLPVIAEVVAKNLAYAYEKLGSWEAAIRSHNAGLTGAQRFKDTGTVIGKPDRVREVTQFPDLVNKWLVGLNGKTSKDAGFIHDDPTEILKDIQEFQEARKATEEAAAKDRKSIQEKYYTDLEKFAEDNKEAIKQINEKFANDPTERDRLLALQQKAYEKDLENYIKSQDEKVKATQQAVQNIRDKINKLNQSAAESWARATLKPDELAQWNLNNELDSKQTNLNGDYQEVKTSINNNVDLGETEKYQMLQDAYKAYLDAKLYLDSEYSTKSREMQNGLNAQTLSGYSSLMGDMSGIAKAFGGEQSKTYKMLFAMQKGFAIASTLLSSKEAISKAWASAAFPYNIPAVAMAVAQTGALTQAVSAITAKGFATGGQIKGPGTGTSDSIPIWASNDEFMIKESSAKKIGLDNLNYMNQTGELPNSSQKQIMVASIAELPQGGDVISAPVTVTVTVNADGSTNVDSDGQAKALGDVLGNAIRQVMLKELRQGGTLYNALRR
ncbi:transglycosylase SLT domain-containing protein [Acinetobacter baumannii]|uniref:transglycosylase SLT domain-containing protein n=1 Tax=Acinetobacter baumannii TaxID=470 RepID=UPI00338D5712